MLILPLCVLCGLCGFGLRASPVAEADAQVGETAPPLKLAKLGGGGEVSLPEGKAVVLCFFATWSRASVEQLKGLVELHGAGVAVIGVCLDAGGPDAAAALVEREAIPFPVGLTGGDPVVATAYALAKLPTVLVVAKDGKVSARFEGFKDPAAVKAEVERLAGLRAR